MGDASNSDSTKRSFLLRRLLWTLALLVLGGMSLLGYTSGNAAAQSAAAHHCCPGESTNDGVTLSEDVGGEDHGRTPGQNQDGSDPDGRLKADAGNTGPCNSDCQEQCQLCNCCHAIAVPTLVGSVSPAAQPGYAFSSGEPSQAIPSGPSRGIFRPPRA